MEQALKKLIRYYKYNSIILGVVSLLFAFITVCYISLNIIVALVLFCFTSTLIFQMTRFYKCLMVLQHGNFEYKFAKVTNMYEEREGAYRRLYVNVDSGLRNYKSIDLQDIRHVNPGDMVHTFNIDSVFVFVRHIERRF